MWQAFLDGFFGALTKQVKVFFLGFFVFWALFGLVGTNMSTFILGHVIVLGIWAYVFKWFRK